MARHRMIISELHKFIFVAIPKTGTHAIRQALREHLGEDDIEQVKLFVQKRFPIPELAKFNHGHLTLQQVQPHLPPETFKTFLKFAFVRNPFDRFVSYCAFMSRGQDTFQTEPQTVMRHFLFTAPPMTHLLFQPQHFFVTGPDGAPMTDFIGRVETMQQSYDELCDTIGIPSRPLDKVNSTSRGDYRDYYDQQLIDGVARLYARDLELFGYSF